MGGEGFVFGICEEGLGDGERSYCGPPRRGATYMPNELTKQAVLFSEENRFIVGL